MHLEQNEPCRPEIICGEDKSLIVKLENEVTEYPFDLTGATEIEAIFMKNDGTGLHKLLTTSGIVILNAPGGAIQINLAASETQVLKISDLDSLSSFEVRVSIAGKKRYVQLKSSIKILASLYPVGF